MKKMYVYLSILLLAQIAAGGCKSREPEKETVQEGRERVELTVWGAEEDEELLKEMFRSFQSRYRDQADVQITYEPQSESRCKDALIAGLEDGADVFAFADDQVAALAAAGALEPIEEDGDIRGSSLDTAVDAASVDGVLYAYPLTADNGYFLYYNKAYFSDEDIKSLERMVEAAGEAGKVVAMDWSSAWYVYAFFGNTGLTVGLNEDGITNHCDWNSSDGPIRGVDVAQSMLDIAASPGFSNRTDQDFLAGVQEGTVIAGVSGVWNAVAIREAWGDNMGAAKLPSYTCRGMQVQMASFSGCKLVGVNAYSSHPQWAHLLARWITSEENQALRFQVRGQGPANVNAANSPDVQKAPAIAALIEQSAYSQLQRVGGKFWDPVAEFAGSMAEGNPSGAPLQEQLDDMVEGVSAR